MKTTIEQIKERIIENLVFEYTAEFGLKALGDHTSLNIERMTYSRLFEDEDWKEIMHEVSTRIQAIKNK